MRTIEFDAGEHIDLAAKHLLAATTLEDDLTVQGIFNGILLTANAESTPESIVAYYHAESERRAEEYRKSPDGIKARREQEGRTQRQTELNAEIDQAIAGCPMKISDQPAWDEFVAKNTDPYSAGVIKFAERWARLMQVRMEDGSKLADIAKQASSEADNEGITGFMYGCAVATLAQTWKHGEELRRWHNLDTQVGTEGERANETGGVLNPALLSIG